MDIAAMSMTMHTAQLQQDVSLAVMRRTMDTTNQAAQTLLQDMAQAQPPSTHLFEAKA